MKSFGRYTVWGYCAYKWLGFISLLPALTVGYAKPSGNPAHSTFSVNIYFLTFTFHLSVYRYEKHNHSELTEK